MRDSVVSQAPRLLRTAGIVQREKDGRIVRYRLVDGQISALLEHCTSRDTTAVATLSGGASGTGRQ